MNCEIAEILKLAHAMDVACDARVAEWLRDPAAIVAFGVSGGKDSCAQTLVGVDFLRRLGFRNPIVLIHSDLGRIEHAASLAQCERLAAKVDCPLIVVKPQREMLEIFPARWQRNVRRWLMLACVTVITPFSSAKLKFCTKEAKITPITQELVRRFPNCKIINAVGIRAEESLSRANKPVSKINEELERVGLNTVGIDWHPIHHLTKPQVFLIHRRYGLREHEAYVLLGIERVSCSCCVLSSLHDLQASLRDWRNHAAYRSLCLLEAESAFSFQPARWLADVRPDLLTAELLAGVARAKEIAKERRLIEKTIPRGLLYCKNFPRYVPDFAEAKILAEARIAIARLYDWQASCTTAEQVIERYAELYQEKLVRQAAAAKKARRKSGSVRLALET